MRCFVLTLLVIGAIAGPLPKTYDSEAAARAAAEAELAALGASDDSSASLTAAAEKAAMAMAKDAERDPMHDGMTGMKIDLGEVEDPEAKKGQVEEPAAPAAEAVPEPVDTANEQTVTQEAPEELPVVKHMKIDDEKALKKKEIAEAKKKEAERMKKEREDSAEGHLIPEGDPQALDELAPKGSRPSAPQFGFGMPMNQMQGFQGPALQSPDLAGNDMSQFLQQPQNPMSMFGMPQIPQNLMNQPLPQMGLGQATGMPSLPEMMQQMQQGLGINQQQATPFMPQLNMGMQQMPQMMGGMPNFAQQFQNMGLPQGFNGQMPQMQMPNFPQMPQMMPQMQMPMQFPQMQMPQA